MNTKVYVNGGLLIETPYFRYMNAGCLFTVPPEGAEIIEANKEIEGKPYLSITENNAPSFFKEYYAKTSFTTYFRCASFFELTIQSILNDFNKRIKDIKTLLSLNDVAEETRQYLYRLSLVAAVAAFDTYISDLVLFVATKDRTSFLKVAKKFCKNKGVDIISRITKMWYDNVLDSAEQEVINNVLKTPFSNLDKINKDVLKDIYNVEIEKDESIETIFRFRHIIAHRSGREKGGKEIQFNKKELLSHISKLESLVCKIDKVVNNSEIIKQLSAQSHNE